MRKISEMYKRSGGTAYQYICSDCRFFYGDKHPRCLQYELEIDWNPDYIACKFYNLEESQIDGQVNIFDLLWNMIIVLTKTAKINFYDIREYCYG